MSYFQILATIKRVVLHLKYRSIGLGEKLVKETLPLVGRPYVEAMAVMAKYNPFFEKAGMTKIAERQPDKEIQKGVEKLEKLGFKPYLLASTQSNLEQLKKLSQEQIAEVKAILADVGYYKRLRATNKPFMSKKDFNEWLNQEDLYSIAQVYLFWKNSKFPVFQK